MSKSESGYAKRVFTGKIRLDLLIVSFKSIENGDIFFFRLPKSQKPKLMLQQNSSQEKWDVIPISKI
jgi:hypothetical protein